IFVANIAGDRAVKALAIRRWNRRCQRCEVVGDVIAVRVTKLNCRAVDVIWRGLLVRSRVWGWGIGAEKQAWYQPKGTAREWISTANRPGKIRAATITSSEGKRVCVTGEGTVLRIDGGAIVGIGNDQYIGLLIPGAGNHPGFCLARIIGGAQVRAADTAADLETAEFVLQKNVDHTCHRIAAINGRGAVLQDVDVINHWKRYEINVHPGGAGPSTSPTPNYGSAFSIDKNESFFGQQTTQVWYDAAISAIGDVLVDGRAHLLR